MKAVFVLHEALMHILKCLLAPIFMLVNFGWGNAKQLESNYCLTWQVIITPCELYAWSGSNSYQNV